MNPAYKNVCVPYTKELSKINIGITLLIVKMQGLPLHKKGYETL